MYSVRSLSLLLSSTLCCSVLCCCTPTARDFKLSALDSNEGAIFGTVQIVRNAADISALCEVCFWINEEQCIQLDPYGAVLLPAEPGVVRLTHFECDGVKVYPGGGWFVSKGAGQASYFGALFIGWQDKSGVSPRTRSLLTHTLTEDLPLQLFPEGFTGVLTAVSLLARTLAGEAVYQIGASQRVQISVYEDLAGTQEREVFSPLKEGSLQVRSELISLPVAASAD